ncbi:DUF6370 family protein [Psychroserpens damuponensis]|uniref:DUF6370 family protein n=1 Tax=Psychroserpens damuponensis TaxID=943936 RepID=UPI00058B0115|nr:DUF6370 family protein [Psychroserpens damuponensis]
MRKVILVFVLVLSAACSSSETQTVQLSCGQCQFGLTTQKGCDLAVKIDDKAYFVDGAHIDDFGDAHDKHTGFCEVIRTAEVSGEVIDDRFKVNTITLKD